jgi:hypothetical protein
MEDAACWILIFILVGHEAEAVPQNQGVENKEFT